MIGYAFLLIGSMCGYCYGKKKQWQYTNYLRIVMITAGICLIAGGIEQFGSKKIPLEQLLRNEVGEGTETTSLVLEVEGELQEEYVISVEEQRLTEEKATELFARARKELEVVILGKNTSLEHISDNLAIPSVLVEGQVAVSCSFVPYAFINADGSIQWDKLENENELVKVTAQMTCQEREAVHEFYLQLVMPNLNEGERLKKEIEAILQKENESEGKAYFELPQEAGGSKLRWYQVKENLHVKVLLFGMIFIICHYIYEKEKREQEEKERIKQLQMDYPNIVNQLSLLVGAGFPILTAWGKMVQQYKEKRELRHGYEEMLMTWNEIQSGIGEIKAYENFGIRCVLPQYRKLASLLMQSTKKGSKGMQQLLDMETKEALDQRRLYAQQLGQEAGTKLLIPMGVMLILVFAILMLPAMLALNIG